MNELEIIKKLFNFVFSTSVMLLLFFILINYEDLDSIEFEIAILGSSENANVNFYTILAVMAIAFGLAILLSLNIMGSGVNDVGSNNIAKLIMLLVLYTLFTIINSYFFLPFGFIGLMIVLFYSIIFFLYSMITLPNSNGGL